MAKFALLEETKEESIRYRVVNLLRVQCQNNATNSIHICARVFIDLAPGNGNETRFDVRTSEDGTWSQEQRALLLFDLRFAKFKWSPIGEET